MAALDTYHSVGREALKARPEGHQQLATLTGLSKQQIYSFRVGAQFPGERPRQLMEQALGISAQAWMTKPAAPLPVVPRGGPPRTISAPTALTTIVEPAPPSEPAPTLVRTGSVENQRGQTLEDVRGLVANLKFRMETYKSKESIASLANSLRQALEKEAELTTALEDTTTGWATSREFQVLVDKIFDALKPYPEAVEAINTVFASSR